MAQSWPSGVPQTMRQSGYNETLQNNTLWQDMDAGPPKSRLRSTAGYDAIAGKISMTAAQVAIFDAWYRSTILYGALSFNFTHPRTSAAIECMIAKSTQPKYTPAGGIRWLVELQLMVMP